MTAIGDTALNINGAEWRNVQFPEKIWELLCRLGSLTFDSIKITPNMRIPICLANRSAKSNNMKLICAQLDCAHCFLHSGRNTTNQSDGEAHFVDVSLGCFQTAHSKISAANILHHLNLLARTQSVPDSTHLRVDFFRKHIYIQKWQMVCVLLSMSLCIPSFCMHEPKNKKTLLKRPEKAANRKINFLPQTKTRIISGSYFFSLNAKQNAKFHLPMWYISTWPKPHITH